MNTNFDKVRSGLLGGVGTAVLATMLATAAYANPAQTSLPTAAPGAMNTVAHVSTTSAQVQNADVDAYISDATGGIDGLVDSGDSAGSTNTVSVNSLLANATGNTYAGTVDLSLVTAAGPLGAPVIDPTADGAAVHSLQVVTGDITSEVTDNTLALTRPGFTSGSAQVDDNRIEATTNANIAGQTIAGITPNGYTSSAEGRSSLEYPSGVPLFVAEGTAVASTLQQAVNSASGATAEGNEVSLNLTADDGNNVAAAPSLDGNSVAAGLTVNSARTTINLQAGGDPAFSGSAVVSNVQGNLGTADQSAKNAESTILATIEGNDTSTDVNTLTGALSVDGNSVSSTARGNDATGTTPGTAGNRILIADALSIDGAGATDPGSAIAYDSGELSQLAVADLVINSSQSNVGDSISNRLGISAETSEFGVGAIVQSVNGGTVSVADNSATATVGGNRASNAVVSGDGAAEFSASVALANQQSNYYVDQTATVDAGTIGAGVGRDGGDVSGSSVGVDGNTTSATVQGNSANNHVALAANTIDVGSDVVTLEGGTGPDGNVRAMGGVTVANLQSAYNSNVTAQNIDSTIGLYANSASELLTRDTLSVSGNTQEAVAVVGAADNSLSLDGNEVSPGAGIASVQVVGSGAAAATLQGASAELVAATNVEDSDLVATGNLQRAIAYGGSASNALSVSSNAPALSPTSADPASVIHYDSSDPLSWSNSAGNLPTVTAAFGVLNDQSLRGDGVTASATNGAVNVDVAGDLTSSTLQNEQNAYVGAAYGNDASSSATLALGNVDTGDFASIASVSNTQAAAGDSISATATGGSVFETTVQGNVEDSGVSTSDNAIQALAFGNRSSGATLNVTGNNIVTAALAPVDTGASYDGDAFEATASFTVQNAQSAHGSISASQLDEPLTPTQAASVLTTVTGNVADATIASDGNQSLASATGNRGTSGVSIDGNALTTTSALQNVQVSDAALSASIGVAGDPGAPLVEYPGNAGSGSIVGGSSYGSGGLLTLNAEASLDIDYSGVTDPTARAALEALLTGAGLTVSGGHATTLAGDSGVVLDLSFFQGFSYSGTAVSFTGFSKPGTAAVPAQGGVRVAVDGDVHNSTLSVDGNSASGSVIANNAANSVAVDGASVASGSGLSGARVDGLGSPGFDAVADHVLSNVQQVSDTDLDSSVYAAFALDLTEGAAIDGSTLSVSGNSQSATAVGNTAGNALALSGNGIDAASVLSSRQAAAAAPGGSVVTASSDMELFAPAAINGSSLSISGNTNSSLAVVNDVTNSATIAGTQVATLDDTAVASLQTTGSDPIASGDHLLFDTQTVSADHEVSSTATTNLYNEDRLNTTGLGVRDSSVTIADNVTRADATSNQASNSLALNGSAGISASAGLANVQSNAANTEADATTNASINLRGTPEVTTPVPVDAIAASSNSSVTLAGNSTTALARGNAASNALNAEAGAGYIGRDAGTSAGTSSAGTVNAQAAVLNNQVNSGDVTATGTATYQVVLNAQSGMPAVVNSSIAVTGNSVASSAYGNTANNTLTLTTLNNGTPTSAIGNVQANYGNITASATSVAFGISNAGGTVGASVLRANGNQVTATAVGNSAASSIVGR